MRQQEFIDALYAAGWTAPNDAQWEKIRRLHRKLFPTVAELEEQLGEMENELNKA